MTDVEWPSWAAQTGETRSRVAAEWLTEHLRFTVPFCVAALNHHARMARPVADWELTYDDHLQHRLSQIGRELGVQLGGREPQQSLASLIGAAGDSMLGESKPGTAATVAMAAAWCIAGIALLSDDGATFRGLHWCRPDGCACPTAAVEEVAA
jgi:hypothetical protein